LTAQKRRLRTGKVRSLERREVKKYEAEKGLNAKKMTAAGKNVNKKRP
jgi:hypothetical protein